MADCGLINRPTAYLYRATPRRTSLAVAIFATTRQKLYSLQTKFNRKGSKPRDNDKRISNKKWKSIFEEVKEMTLSTLSEMGVKNTTPYV